MGNRSSYKNVINSLLNCFKYISIFVVKICWTRNFNIWLRLDYILLDIVLILKILEYMIDFDIIIHTLRLNKLHSIFVIVQDGFHDTRWFLLSSVCLLFLFRLMCRTVDSYVINDLDLTLINIYHISWEAITTWQLLLCKVNLMEL